MLRMDKDKTKDDRLKRVEQVLGDVSSFVCFLTRNLKFEIKFQKLNLKKCENTMIGIPDKNIKGISGGEKRRLSFATEVILLLSLKTIEIYI
jgi:hypothetical protein